MEHSLGLLYSCYPGIPFISLGDPVAFIFCGILPGSLALVLIYSLIQIERVLFLSFTRKGIQEVKWLRPSIFEDVPIASGSSKRKQNFRLGIIFTHSLEDIASLCC